MARRKKSHHSHGTPNRPRLWGKHAVAAALDNPERKVLRAWATREAAAFMQFPKDVAGHLRRRRRPRPAGAARRAAPGRGDRGRAARGRLARRPARPARRSGAVLLVLDQVTDPHNVGAILRSAAAFGAVGIVTQDRHSPPESGALAKAASGALERVPWVRVVNLARALEEIGEAGFWRIGLAGEADTELEGRARPAARRAGAGRRRPGHAAQHARALRRAGAAADQRRDRKPQRLQRRRGRALRGEHRLMVRTEQSIRKQRRRAGRARAGLRRGARNSTACPSRATASRGATTLLRTIVGQQVSVAAARSMWAKLEAAFGSPPDLKRCSRRATRSCARPACRGRRPAISAASPSWSLSGELDLDHLPEDDEEAIALLTKIKGIGRWSAEIYLLFAEGRADVLPAGDLAVQIEIGRLLGLDGQADRKAAARTWPKPGGPTAAPPPCSPGTATIQQRPLSYLRTPTGSGARPDRRTGARRDRAGTAPASRLFGRAPTQVAGRGLALAARSTR